VIKMEMKQVYNGTGIKCIVSCGGDPLIKEYDNGCYGMLMRWEKSMQWIFALKETYC
jgi:hypothetical protein